MRGAARGKVRATGTERRYTSRRRRMGGNARVADAFRPEFLSRFDIKAPVRIPKSFHTDGAKPYHIPCIEMPAELQDMLDYEGKIDRGSENIGRLIAEGEKAAEVFLKARAEAVAASSLGENQTAGQAVSNGDGFGELPLSRWRGPPDPSE